MENKALSIEELARKRKVQATVKKLIYRGITLGECLKTIRFLYGTNYTEMADIIGVSRGRICNITKQEPRTSESLFAEYIIKLDLILNLDLKELEKQWD